MSESETDKAPKTFEQRVEELTIERKILARENEHLTREAPRAIENRSRIAELHAELIDTTANDLVNSDPETQEAHIKTFRTVVTRNRPYNQHDPSNDNLTEVLLKVLEITRQPE